MCSRRRHGMACSICLGMTSGVVECCCGERGRPLSVVPASVFDPTPCDAPDGRGLHWCICLRFSPELFAFFSLLSSFVFMISLCYPISSRNWPMIVSQLRCFTRPASSSSKGSNGVWRRRSCYTTLVGSRVRGKRLKGTQEAALIDPSG
jgi:hypothetical protein